MSIATLPPTLARFGLHPGRPCTLPRRHGGPVPPARELRDFPELNQDA
jgi:hypothetical protein